LPSIGFSVIVLKTINNHTVRPEGEKCPLGCCEAPHHTRHQGPDDTYESQECFPSFVESRLHLQRQAAATQTHIWACAAKASFRQRLLINYGLNYGLLRSAYGDQGSILAELSPVMMTALLVNVLVSAQCIDWTYLSR
jgi:hypothetical protein